MSKEIREYDGKGNLIHYKSSCSEYWRRYNENNKEIHFKNTSGFECWKEYNENNLLIHYKSTTNFEYWVGYDENNKRVEITQQEFKQIERTKLYFNNKKINRFEIMDI